MAGVAIQNSRGVEADTVYFAWEAEAVQEAFWQLQCEAFIVHFVWHHPICLLSCVGRCKDEIGQQGGHAAANGGQGAVNEVQQRSQQPAHA